MIRLPITISPHSVKGNPRGYYVLAQRLFPHGAPILAKKQFVGFWRKALVITVSHKNEWDSLLKMALNVPELSFWGEEGTWLTAPVTWLGEAKLWPMPMGFRTFVSGKILKPNTAEARKVTSTGVFFWKGMEVQDVTILKVPAISADVLLGRKELCNVD